MQKHLRQDKKKFMIEQLEILDEQLYRWQGIHSLRKKFVPKHCKFKESPGNYIPESRFPEKAAEYLGEVEWKTLEGNYVPRTQTFSQRIKFKKDAAWEIDGLNEVIKNLRRNKAPGPDKVAAELIK